MAWVSGMGRGDAWRGPGGLPALGLDVVDVGVFARPDRRHYLADVDAVLVDGVVGIHVAQRHLVADGDRLQRGHGHDLVLIHDPGVQPGAGLDPFHHGHGHGVLGVVQHYVNHRRLLCVGRLDGFMLGKPVIHVNQLIYIT
ncbi:hypothetical protein CO2235_30107 [Cupriavidus oxalaticus]|uniref:Uncharacterized protein n=1 Tax=Cupriavidus oxalaticus TaxID=96344 RepID=A0A375G9Y1_9BURK|nr:hypothetical protein CO2235_30107 [Cupriavidus oxalaticus]